MQSTKFEYNLIDLIVLADSLILGGNLTFVA